MTSGVAEPTTAGAVKVCGVTRIEDARRCVDLGFELVGLNFHPPSPRFLGEEEARGIRRAIGDRALVVGVFVHHTPREATAIASRVGLDLLQFHGEQQPADLEEVAERSLVVLRPGDEGRAARLARAGLWGVLFDAPLETRSNGETLFGGTGSAWDYGGVAGLGGSELRLMLAGGIGPDNARRALSVRGVWGIDVCSSVESSPGVKDPARLEALRAAVAAHPQPVTG